MISKGNRWFLQEIGHQHFPEILGQIWGVLCGLVRSLVGGLVRCFDGFGPRNVLPIQLPLMLSPAPSPSRALQGLVGRPCAHKTSCFFGTSCAHKMLHKTFYLRKVLWGSCARIIECERGLVEVLCVFVFDSFFFSVKYSMWIPLVYYEDSLK